jgi:hypothetical protein
MLRSRPAPNPFNTPISVKNPSQNDNNASNWLILMRGKLSQNCNTSTAEFRHLNTRGGVSPAPHNQPGRVQSAARRKPA